MLKRLNSFASWHLDRTVALRLRASSAEQCIASSSIAALLFVEPERYRLTTTAHKVLQGLI